MHLILFYYTIYNSITSINLLILLKYHKFIVYYVIYFNIKLDLNTNYERTFII